MQILFVGLGSIGTRHLKNLSDICARRGLTMQVDALRSSTRSLAPEINGLLRNQCISYDQLAPYYDIAFITNPTHLHADTISKLSDKVGSFFIEKPIFENVGYSLEQLGLPETKKAYVAAPMRWCGTFLALKKMLPSLRPYNVRVICSSYLPDWRPGVDYRTVYSAHKEMGGGVTIDLIHEWDYMVDLFGLPIQSYNFKGRYSQLEIDSDDISVYIARYPRMLAEIHLDYFGRDYRRSIELFCKEGTAVADFAAGTITLPDGTVQHYEEPLNQRYVCELEYFLDYIAGSKAESINSPGLALDILRLTLGE